METLATVTVAAFALIGLFTGCATLSKVGDGKLEPATNGVTGRIQMIYE